MKSFILLILVLATLLPVVAQASYDVLILQSRREAISDEIVTSFIEEHKSTQRVIVASDYAEVDVVRIVREDHPRMILTVGDRALSLAKKVQNIPILAVMSAPANPLQQSQPNLFRIDVVAPPEQYLTIFQWMKKNRVGVVYNRGKSGSYVQLAQQIAAQMNVQLVTREVTTPSEAIAQLASMAGKIDALWMLPDPIVVTRETFKEYSSFAKDQSIPLVSFAKPYLKMGAAAVVVVDWTLLGRQAAEISKSIYKISPIDKSLIYSPKNYSVISNRSLLKSLGIE